VTLFGSSMTHCSFNFRNCIESCLGMSGETGWEGLSQHNMLSTCKGGLRPQTSRNLGLIFWNWGVIMFYMAQDVVAVCGKWFSA